MVNLLVNIDLPKILSIMEGNVQSYSAILGHKHLIPPQTVLSV